MGLVPEERLTQYLALASGLPPAARDEGASPDRAALATVTRELAEQYRAVPVAFERDAIRVLVCAPLELSELEDLADLLDRPLQPLITPEYRWNLVFAGAYGLDPPARFTTLARSLDVDPAAEAVGKAPSIIVEERDSAPSAVPIATDLTERTPEPYGAARLSPVPPEAETLRLLTDPGHDDIARGRRHTIIGVVPNRAATDGMASHGPDEITPPSGTLRRMRSGLTPASGHAAARPSGSQPTAVPDPQSSSQHAA